MIAFPNAKINIGLRVTGKLPSGYHTLKSLMIPTGFCDILEFIPSKKDILYLTGISIPGNNEENLLWKVLKLLREEYTIPPLHIHLHKIIPAGAGLGGGSADAAFFLNMLNEFFKLEMTECAREKMISLIGSDCSFFIRNQPAIITGTGDKIHPFETSLKGMFLTIAFPGFSISTAEAYAGIKPEKETLPLEDLLKKDMDYWKNQIKNDFEETLFKDYPELKKMKEAFYDSGALYASMSGSGSALYGIFDKKPCFNSRLEEQVIYADYFS